MVKLSLVIPYYECYEYTKELLDILTQQLTEEIEVILIDDGCNEERLDEYKDKINIIHLKENNGAGHSYNTGIENATGQYIGFIDADDSVSNDYIQVLLKAINDNPTDVIYLDWKDIFTGEIITRPDNYAPWKAIYKKEITPRFCEENFYHPDVAFYDELKRKGFSKSYVDKVLYYYNPKRPGNLTERNERCK